MVTKTTKRLLVGPTALAASIAAMGVVVPVGAQAELTANIGVTSNYIWRGRTQTDDSAAVYGGVDWNHDSGLYLGTWVSNVDFKDSNGGMYEIDFYGGYAGEVGDLGYSVGAIYYAYPDADKPDNQLDFSEINASISYGYFSAGLDYTVDTEWGGKDDDLHYYVGASFEPAETWTLGGTVGHYDYDDSATKDYTWFQIDLTKSAGDFGDFTLSGSKLNEKIYDDDLKFFVSWSKTF